MIYICIYSHRAVSLNHVDQFRREMPTENIHHYKMNDIDTIIRINSWEFSLEETRLRNASTEETLKLRMHTFVVFVCKRMCMCI